MKTEYLINLAHRKNGAKRALLEKRSRAYMPTGTDQMKKVVMDADCAKEQEAYDNLCDEWTVALMAAEAAGDAEVNKGKPC